MGRLVLGFPSGPITDSGALEGLLARKERRRAKAVIVKNRNQSATAVGAAAAAKVKASHRSSKRLKGDNPDEPASDAESTSPKPKKKKRKASNEDINKDLQDVKKAKNVGASRLTVRLGLDTMTGPHADGTKSSAQTRHQARYLPQRSSFHARQSRQGS